MSNRIDNDLYVTVAFRYMAMFTEIMGRLHALQCNLLNTMWDEIAAVGTQDSFRNERLRGRKSLMYSYLQQKALVYLDDCSLEIIYKAYL